MREARKLVRDAVLTGLQPRAENDVVVGSNAPGAGMRAARTDRN